MLATDYGQFSLNSLKQFYTDILNKFEKKKTLLAKDIFGRKVNNLNDNYYYLLFDAMRMLPDFKERHHEEQREELRAWKKIISIARQNNEINTQMTDEHTAKLFIYLGDGTNIKLIMGDKTHKMKNELSVMWDNLYSTIKT